jgi:hypothetical protein
MNKNPKTGHVPQNTMHFHVYMYTCETVTRITVSINYIFTIQCKKLRLEWNITYTLGRYSYQITFNQPLDKHSIRKALQISREEKKISCKYINHDNFPYWHSRINFKTCKNIHLLLLDFKHYSREKILLSENYSAKMHGHPTWQILSTISPLMWY